jgi:hypothetical protein
MGDFPNCWRLASSKGRVAPMDRKPLFSVEGAVSVLIAIIAAVADMSWWLRALLVLVAAGLVPHLAWRIPGNRPVRVFVGIMVSGFWSCLRGSQSKRASARKTPSRQLSAVLFTTLARYRLKAFAQSRRVLRLSTVHLLQDIENKASVGWPAYCLGTLGSSNGRIGQWIKLRSGGNS